MAQLNYYRSLFFFFLLVLFLFFWAKIGFMYSIIEKGYKWWFLLKSTTTTLTLSVLCLAKANLVNRIDASEQALSELSDAPPTAALLPGDMGGECGFRARKHMRATLQAVSFDTTSQSPSLARIRHSSSAVRSVIVTSGSDITYGFK